MIGTIDERAPAKVNLTLSILGRRPDGYHALESLVAFANVGDRLTLDPGTPLSFCATGHFANALGSVPAGSFCATGHFANALGSVPAGGNLVERAAMAAREAVPDLVLGAFTLHKTLPVAAGLGGGSGDAAAALRAVQRANPGCGDGIDWVRIAAGLGADVPVCLGSRAAMMRGVGEQVTPLPRLPELTAVLVNPGVPLSTAAVFAGLEVPPLPAAGSDAPRPMSEPSPGPFLGLADLLAYIAPRPNDLEATARRLCPVVATVIEALKASDGCVLARLSGSGPTCFGLYEDTSEASAAARGIASDHPSWWVRETELG